MDKKTSGIARRVNPKNEIWYLRIKNEEVFTIRTITKRERLILNAIRKILIAFDYTDIDLTNRKKYVKNVNVSQSKLMEMKANDNHDLMQSGVFKNG